MLSTHKVDLTVTLVSPCLFNLVIGKKVVLGSSGHVFHAPLKALIDRKIVV